MVYRDILNVFLLSHILSDFYFQNEVMVEKKKNDIDYVFIHSLVYAVITGILAEFIFKDIEGVFVLTIMISHFIIELANYYVERYKLLKKYQNYFFIINQITYITILLVVTYYMLRHGKVYTYNPAILNMLGVMGITTSSLIIFFVQILLIHKPTNLFIVSILQPYKPSDKDTENNRNISTNRVGRMIGTIERIIMLFFLWIKQYSSVGLVLTAKSIARYNKISEDKEFAEYYLLGTLLSTICVLIVSVI